MVSDRAEKLLKQAKQELVNEQGRLMIMGRGFMPDEEKRYHIIPRVKELIDNCITLLEPGEDIFNPHKSSEAVTGEAQTEPFNENTDDCESS